MGVSVKETLKGMSDLWNKSQAAYDTMFGGAKVPGGVYDAKLTQCYLRVAQSGNPYVGREFTILEGEQEGAKVYDRLMLHNETGPVFVRRFIDQCGYQQPKKPEELEALCQAIHKAGLDFQIKVVHNGDFVNVQILKTLSEVAEEAATDEATDTSTEEAADDAPVDEANEEFRKQLIEFARTQDVKVGDNDSLEDVVTEMKRYTFEEIHLEPEEIQLLTDAGLVENIERKPKAPPPAPPKAKPTASAPARPPVGKPVGKPAAPAPRKR